MLLESLTDTLTVSEDGGPAKKIPAGEQFTMRSAKAAMTLVRNRQAKVVERPPVEEPSEDAIPADQKREARRQVAEDVRFGTAVTDAEERISGAESEIRGGKSTKCGREGRPPRVSLPRSRASPVPISLRHGRGRERFRVYVKATDTADHRVSESYVLQANATAADGAWPATRGAPPGAYSVVAGRAEERVDAVFGFPLACPVVEGAVLASTRETDPVTGLPRAYVVTSVEDVRRLGSRLAKAVAASGAVYDLLAEAAPPPDPDVTPYAALLAWDTLADGAVPATAIPHRLPVRRAEVGRRSYVPRSAEGNAAAGRWAFVAQPAAPDDGSPGDFVVSGGATVTADPYPGPAITTAAAYAAASPADGASASFRELGAVVQGPGEYAGTVAIPRAQRLTVPASGAASALTVPFAAAPPDYVDSGAAGTTIGVAFAVGRARDASQVGKKVTLRVSSGADPATPLAPDTTVTLTTADQYPVVEVTYTAFPAGGIAGSYVAYGDESQRATDLTVLRATAYPYARPWAAPGNTRRATQQFPIHDRYGLLVQWPTRNSWLGSDRAANVTVANGTLTETAAPSLPAPDAADADVPNDPTRVLWLLTPDATHETYLVGPVAPHGVNASDSELGDLTGPPTAIWGVLPVFGATQPAAGALAFFLNPNGSIPDQTPIVAMTPAPRAVSDAVVGTDGTLWWARVPVNTAAQGFTSFQPAIRYTGAAPLLVYRPASIAEQLGEARQRGWHSCLTPPASPLAGPPTISDQVYVTVPMADYLTREQGVAAVEVRLPFDPVQLLWDTQASFELNVWQGGLMASNALGGHLILYGTPDGAGGGVVAVRAVHSSDRLNDGTPSVAAEADGARLEFHLTQPGLWPAMARVRLALRWSAGGFDDVYLRVGAASGAWYAAGDALPAGYDSPRGDGTLDVDGKPTAGAGNRLWDFTGPFAVGADRDITNHLGGFVRAVYLGKAAGTRAEVEACYAAVDAYDAAHGLSDPGGA